MSGLLILIIIVFGIPYLFRRLWPYILRWVLRWGQRRTEDYFRNQMGTPPRDEQQSRRQSSSYGSSQSRNYYTKKRKYRSGPVIPKEYAEDVEFTEVRSYSESTVIADQDKVSYARESQVSDAEILEIKKDK